MYKTTMTAEFYIIYGMCVLVPAGMGAMAGFEPTTSTL